MNIAGNQNTNEWFEVTDVSPNVTVGDGPALKMKPPPATKPGIGVPPSMMSNDVVQALTPSVVVVAVVGNGAPVGENEAPG
jgi:hypothetical protein